MNRPAPAAPPPRSWSGASGRQALAALGGLTAAAAAGWLAATRPDLLRVDLSPSPAALAVLGAGLALAVLALRRPDLGLPLLVAFVHLNLSQVLVRHHDLPSLLPLLAVALFMGARLRESAPAPAPAWLLRRPLTAFLVLYLLLLLLSTAHARSTELADEALVDTAKALAVCVLLPFLASSPPVLRRGVWALLGSGMLLGAIAVLQVATGSFQFEYGGLGRVKHAHIYGTVFEPRIAGPLGDPNFFAQILVPLVPIALFTAWTARRRHQRLLAYSCAGLVIAAIVLTYSRGGALALGVVLTLSLLARRVRPGRAAAAAALLAVAAWLLPGEFTRRLGTIGQILPGGEPVLHPDSSFEKRKLLTQVAWRVFLDHPLLGVGAGNYTVYFEEYADRVGSVSREYEELDERHYPHSLYLEIAAETGLPGLASFAAAVAAALISLRRSRARFLQAGDLVLAAWARAFAIALAGFLVSSLFLHGHYPRYLWMWFGFVLALDALGEQATAGAGGGGGTA